MTRACRDRNGAEDALGIERSPLQHLHAAHRAAGDAKQLVDAQPVDQHGLGAHHVADRHQRQVEAVGLSGYRIDRRRPRRAHAAADHVRADDEIAVGVDRPPGTDHGFPPAGLAGQRMTIGDMLVAGERMTDEHGVRFRRVERPIGLVGDRQRRERHARIHQERLTVSELGDKAVRRIGFALRRAARHDKGIGFVQHALTGCRSIFRTYCPFCRRSVPNVKA